ncbi:MAG: hypothetical protein LRY55_14090, partial [Leadbetterella sp.]|nr:hypothetical protein [Leadbetterella sp.]
MKSFNKLLISVFAFALLVTPGCTDVLEERPYTVFSTDYFKTPEGLQAGIASLYSGFRFLF